MRARITKVGQTNIDEILVGFFLRRVNFWFPAIRIRPKIVRRKGHRLANPGAETRRSCYLKKNCSMPGTNSAPVHLIVVSSFREQSQEC
jgi:hypothetical protein